jgi:hypothetical protein
MMNATAARMTEHDIIERTRRAMSDALWELGETGAKWLASHARFRPLSVWAAVVGVEPARMELCVKVWETFSDVRMSLQYLHWAHFRAALDWEDPMSSLQWANDINATVAEMKAWRRAQSGEDLSVVPIPRGTLF